MSPKNKGHFGKGKAPVEEPDEFVQTVNTLSDRIEPHLKKIAVVVGIGATALVGWTVYDWMQEKKAKKATRAYAEVMHVVDGRVVAEGDTAPEDRRPNPVMTFSSEEERINAGLAAISDLKKDKDEIGLSALTANREAKLLFEAGRYDEAQQAFMAASKKGPDGLRLAALEGVGYSIEAKAMAEKDAAARQSGLESALRAFENLQPNEGGPMRDYALYHQARILVALGKTDEGVAKFKQVLSELPDSPLSVDVEERLAALSPGGE